MSGLPRRRHLVSLADLDHADILELVTSSSRHAAANGEAVRPGPLAGTVVGVYFRKTSTRTRTSFSVAAHRLGADVIAYGPDDLQENTGETVPDTARVLASMLDAFVARTAGDPAELATLAGQSTMAVINAMTSDEHPTQAIADLATVRTLRGGLDGVRICYFGEGNSTAAALALAVARIPDALLHLVTPPGYGLPAATLGTAQRLAAPHRARIAQSHDPTELPEAADIVYTTRWQTTGTSKPDPDWRAAFRPFRVTGEVMARFPGASFMHDLPAHRGEEVEADVLDGDRSIAFVQARHKLYSAMAVLEWTVGPVGR